MQGTKDGKYEKAFRIARKCLFFCAGLALFIVLSNVAIPNSTHYSSFGFLKTVNDICNIIAPFDLLFGVLSLIWTFVLAIVKEF